MATGDQVAAAFAAAAVLSAAAAAWERLGAGGQALPSLRRGLAALAAGRGRALPEAARRLAIPHRIEAAGLAGRLSPRAVLAAKAAGLALGLAVALLAAPAAPGRLAPLVAVALPAAGFVAPDALLERRVRHRWRRLRAALPDALDLMAVGVAAGRGAGAVLAGIAARTSGPLAAELAVTAAEIESGVPQTAALEALRRRAPGGELAALAAAIERSRRHGSPLADQLREQANGLRRDQRRRLGEAAARAAPKIQLVVALVLVPSVLLMIVAALIANSEALFRVP